jgi:hypothetical protein
MLNDSETWKVELQKLLADFRRAASSQDMAQEFDAIIFERPILYIAIAVRRLIESRKISDNTRNQTYPVTNYPTLRVAKDKFHFAMGLSDLASVFDMASGAVSKIDLWDLCSELIHSSYLVWGVDDKDRLVSIYVASVRNQKSRILAIDFGTFEVAVQSIIDDTIDSISISYPSGKLKVTIR